MQETDKFNNINIDIIYNYLRAVKKPATPINLAIAKELDLEVAAELGQLESKISYYELINRTKLKLLVKRAGRPRKATK